MFFILPVGMDYRARRYPVVTFTLMGICTAVYLVTLFALASGDTHAKKEWIYENLWLTPNKLYWWTFLTSQFVHSGILHLAGNMIYLFLFGACVEDMIGRLRFTIFYLLCGIGAAATHVALAAGHHDAGIPMGGASGAISGCIGGYLLLRANAKIEFKWVFVFWIIFFFRVWNGEFTLPAWLVISFWFLEDFVSMILKMMADHPGGGVAFAAHVGGTLVGLGLIGLVKLLPQPVLPDEEDEEEEAKPQVVVRAPVVVARAPIRIRVNAAATAPAIDEPPTIHLSWGGSQSGPFSRAQIEQMFRGGEIPAEALYWQEGMEDWRTAEELREPGMA